MIHTMANNAQVVVVNRSVFNFLNFRLGGLCTPSLFLKIMKRILIIIYILNFCNTRLEGQSLIRNGDLETKLRDSSSFQYLSTNWDVSNYTSDWHTIFYAEGPFYINNNSWSNFASPLSNNNYKNFKPFKGNGFFISQSYFREESVENSAASYKLHYTKSYTGSLNNKVYREWGFFQNLSSALIKDSLYVISYRYKMGLDIPPGLTATNNPFSYRQVYSHFGVLFTTNDLTNGTILKRKDTNELFPFYKKELQDTIFDTTYKWRLVEFSFKADSNYNYINFARFQHQDSAKYYFDTFKYAYFFNQVDDIRLFLASQYLKTSNDTTICIGDTIILKVLSGAGGYKWRNTKYPNTILSTDNNLKIISTESESIYEVMSPFDTASIVVYANGDYTYDTINYSTCENKPLKISTPNIFRWYDNTRDTAKTFTTTGNYWYVTRANCNVKRTQINIKINYSKDDTIKQASCDSFLYKNNTYIYSGTYTYPYKSINGCDSFYSLDLKIYPSKITTQSQFSCTQYKWLDSTYNKSGTYSRKYKTVHQCDSILKLNLNIGLDNKLKIENGIHYTALQDNVFYQWYRCNPWRRITNETKKTFITKTKGSYAVVLDDGKGCRDTSDCIELYSSQIQQSTVASIVWSVHPNPFNEVFHISLNRTYKTIQVRLYDLMGRLVITETMQYNSEIKIKNSELPKGSYYLQVETETTCQFFNLQKE